MQSGDGCFRNLPEVNNRMVFVYSKWEKFCRLLKENDITSVTAETLLTSGYEQQGKKRFVTLKHDVESNPAKALDIARIESSYGHHASYYVQAYLMTDENQSVFKEIQALGHEVSYHHSVIDFALGDISLAMNRYEQDVDIFQKYGFPIKTVCQHGDSSSQYENRDFFRSQEVRNKFPDHSDLMVDFMERIGHPYTYISDVGMQFKIINDPLLVKNLSNEDEYIVLGGMDSLLSYIIKNPSDSFIISAHPHRYSKSAAQAVARKFIFRCLKSIGKIIFLIPGVRKFVFKNNNLIRYI